MENKELNKEENKEFQYNLFYYYCVIHSITDFAETVKATTAVKSTFRTNFPQVSFVTGREF